MLTVKIKNPNYVEGGSDKWIPISALTQSIADGIVVNDGDGTKYLADDGVYKEVITDLSQYYTKEETDVLITSKQYATKDELNTHATEAREYTDTVITNLVNAAPDTLDTLGELAQAILDNEDVVELLESSVTNKLDKTEAEQTYATKEDVTITTPMDVPNGVYVVTSSGELVDKSAATPDCIGVAFISDNQKVMISKANATYSSNTTLYWGNNLYQKDVAGITNISSQDAAKADFGGKTNTEAIIAAYGQHSVDMGNRDICKVLSTYAEGGFTDWYVPAAGQLYEMYTNKTDINAALANIGGTAFASGYYWSSSEYDADSAWIMGFYDGYVNSGYKDNSYTVRFVRDLTLETKISLKDKVSQIESTIPTKVSQLDNDNNYVYNSNSLINDIQVVSALPESP